MKLNIITENQARIFARIEVRKVEKAFWIELEKLRKRIVELEKRDMDINKLKLHQRNEK